MQLQDELPQKLELYLPDLDNRVLVLNQAGGVVVLASRDNVSENRKSHFIRHLAAEGYIPDRYEWFSEPQVEGFSGVQWVALPSLGKTNSPRSRLHRWCANRNVRYGCLFLIWLALFVYAARHTTHGLWL